MFLSVLFQSYKVTAIKNMDFLTILENIYE